MTLLFPLHPDWSQTYKVVREFKTDIITSRSGKEQRRATRNRARKRIEFQVTEFGDRFRLFARSMNKQIGATIQMPDYSRAVRMTGTLAAGGSTVAISDSSPPWLFGSVVLVNGDTMEVHVVANAAGGVLTLADTATLRWAPGTMVYPALTGRLAQEIQATRITDNVIQAAIVFDVTPTSEPEFDPPAAAVTFNGREVFTAKPNWGATISAGFKHPWEVVDYGHGPVAYFQPVAYSTLAHQAVYLSMSAAAMGAIEDTFTRAKGQRGEFYMPSWASDLPPKTTASAGSSTLLVAGLDLANAYANDTVFDSLCVVFSDGTLAFNRVSSITPSGGDSLLTLTAAWARDVNPAAVSMICWMPLCRFATDGMTSEWISNSVAQSQLSVVSLEDLPPES